MLQMADARYFPKPFYFSPFKVNEPLLDSRLIPLIAQFNQLRPDCPVRVFTNGAPLTFEKIHAIARLENIAHLWVSLNSTVPDEYKGLMNIEYANTARKLDTLHDVLSQGGFPHSVMLSRVSQSEETDNRFVRDCYDRWPLFANTIIKRDGWLGYVAPGSPEIPPTPCVRWFELSIVATGIVSLCCMDGKADYPIGNVHHSSLLEIYNAPHWRERREKMLSRADVHPCSTCTY
jgi:MoaA/NifB/PqqE/SkfB family radical SAM enzyme